MDGQLLVVLACAMMAVSAWSIPYYPGSRIPIRVTRYAPAPPHFFRHPIRPAHHAPEEQKIERPKREHDWDEHEPEHEHKSTRGVTGPVHTFVKTDKNANYKWGVRHHVGNKFAS